MTERNTVSFGAEGENAMALLRWWIDGIDLSDVVGVHVEFETTTPVSPADGQGIGGGVGADDVHEREQPPDEAPDVSDGDEHDHEQQEGVEDDESDSESADSGLSHVTDLHTNGTPARLLGRLADVEDRFRDLDEVRDLFPDSELNRMGNLSASFWDLADRGLVEKKPHPEDGRKKRYRITSRGESAVEKLRARDGDESGEKATPA